MENFVFENPTRIIFGKDTHKVVGKEVKKYSDRILLHYGMGSIKKSGLYDRIIQSLKKEKIEFFELGGVKPNPGLDLTIKGSGICRKEGIDFILAAGGGSVIDSAKAIALNVPYKGGNMWDFVTGRAVPVTALPVGVILTIPASGSESSDAAVITNEDRMIKKGYHSDLIRPVFAILNPELAFTLPDQQLASGAADIMAHVMERYFTRTKNTDLTDRLCEAAMRTVMENAPLALKYRRDYNATAELMWAGNLAHNGLLSTGRTGDWGSHKIGHELSTCYGVPHGSSLSIVFPAWIKYVYNRDIDMFYKFSVRVFDVDPCFGTPEDVINKGIERLVSFYRKLGLPTSLGEIGAGKEKFEEMAEKATLYGPIGNYIRLEMQDVINIYNLAL
jgi:alcohol dehydrogenase